MLPFNKNRKGQNVTEYLILMAGVLAVVIVAASSKGFFTQGVNKALNMMFDSVEIMATVPCLTSADTVSGGWGSWTSWTPCASCSQIRTRACDNPAPQCGGPECTLTDTSKGLLETETQPCSGGNWVTGTCGACTGDCGSTSGTCPRVVTCDGGCCAPASEPSSTASCTKLQYPDAWVEFSNWTCGASCDPAIAGQTVTCGGGDCCDFGTKPLTRRACTEGCCARSLAIGTDVVTGGDLMGTFGPAVDGQSVALTCPSGYAGNPARTCAATASSSGSCMSSDDSFVPPASCYNIAWGALTDGCMPASCPAVSVDAGYGRTWDIPGAAHGATVTLTCSDGGWHYTGNASYSCWLGAWQNLNAGCVPNCPADPVSIGAGLTGAFPETVAGGTVNISCASYDEGPACGQKRYEGSVSRTCSLGTWSAVAGSCGYKPCGTELFMDPSALVLGTFPASPHGTPQTLTCAAIDNRYNGTFSRTCDYGQWCGPDGGCTANPCPGWTTNSNGVNVTFTAAAHGTPQTLNCNSFDNTYTGTVSATCDFGSWINLTGGCAPFQCINPISPSNATMCAGDNTALTADTSWSVVGNGGCTATKCQYECNVGYVQSGLDCVAAQCTGPNPDPSGFATACAGDGNPLVNTPRTLKSSCSSPAGSDPKCEYYCGSYAYCASGPKCYTPLTCASYSLCDGGSTAYSNGCTNSLTCQACNCTCPGGTVIASGTSCPTPYYQSSSVPCGSTCGVPQTRTCTNGVLSGSYTNAACNVAACASCPNVCGTTLLHGQSKTCYQSGSVPCGSSCVPETRTCNNGVASGTYTNATCGVAPCCQTYTSGGIFTVPIGTTSVTLSMAGGGGGGGGGDGHWGGGGAGGGGGGASVTGVVVPVTGGSSIPYTAGAGGAGGWGGGNNQAGLAGGSGGSSSFGSYISVGGGGGGGTPGGFPADIGTGGAAGGGGSTAGTNGAVSLGILGWTWPPGPYGAGGTGGASGLSTGGAGAPGGPYANGGYCSSADNGSSGSSYGAGGGGGNSAYYGNGTTGVPGPNCAGGNGNPGYVKINCP